MKKSALLATTIGMLFALSASAQVVKIDQDGALNGITEAGDDPGFPVTIMVPGSYVLASDLVAPPLPAAAVALIEVHEPHVKLNLRGFALRGQDDPSHLGRGVDGRTTTHTTVTNGSVVNVGNNGLDLGANSRVANVHVSDADGHAVAIRDSGIIANMNISNTGGFGVIAHGSGVRVSNTTVNVCFHTPTAPGIGVAPGGAADGLVVTGSTVQGCAGGIDVGPNGTEENNVVLP